MDRKRKEAKDDPGTEGLGGWRDVGASPDIGAYGQRSRLKETGYEKSS